MKKIIAAIMCMGLALSSMAQISPFLQKGQSGFGIGLGLEKGQNFNGFSAKIGTSVKGVFDIEVNYFRDQINQYMEDRTLLSDDATANYSDVLLTWWLLRSKASDFIDVNFGLAPGFEFSSSNKYEYKNDENVTEEYKGYYGGELGMSSNFVLHLENSWMLMPFYNLYYEVGHDKVSVSQDEHKFNYHGFTSNFGITLGKKFEQGNSLYFSFKQSSATYGPDEYYNLEIGYVLPW